MPWPKLLAFRKDHEQQELEFRNTVAAVAEKIPKGADPDAIKDTLQSERKRLRAALSDHEKALDRLVTSTAASSFQIGIPTLFAKALSATSLPAESVVTLTGTAVAVIGVGWWAKYKAERARLLASPYQYLLSVDRLTTPFWRRLTRR